LEIKPAMLGSERREAPESLRELTLGADPSSASRLIPRDRDVHEPLEEVALLGRRRAPRVLELLVRGEVLARSDQLEAPFKS